MTRRLIAAIAALVAGIVGSLVAVAPAQAAPSDCPSGYMCIWTNINGTGARFQWSYGTIVDSYHNGVRLGSGITNRGLSFYNRTGSAIRIYDDPTCHLSPWARDMSNGQYATAQGSDWGNRVSSFQLQAASPLTC